MQANKPVSLYLVVPPSDISRTKPLVRLILNQIGRRLTEKLATRDGDQSPRQLLLMLDEFPALGRLDFFETSLAFMAGYGLRSFLIAQSLNQIEKAYGPNNSILDNCHVRIAFATNDERTAKRLSEAIGSTTEMRSMRNYAGHRLAPWLSHVMVSRQETARQLITPGEIMQLPPDDELVLLSGFPPIRAKKLKYYLDKNFTGRVQNPPTLSPRGGDFPRPAPCDWGTQTRPVDDRLYPFEEEKAEDGKTENAGKGIEPKLPEKERKSERSLEDELLKEVDEEQELTIATKLGQFERQTTQLARVHDISRTTEPEMGI